MRNFGLVVFCVGALLFFFCHTQMSGLGPIPPDTPLGDYFQYESGKWELGRYASAVAALIGLLLGFFPKGR